MKKSYSLVAALALAATAAQAGLVQIGPCPDPFSGNPTAEFNRLLALITSADPQPNGSFIKYNQGVSQVDDSGDLLTPFTDSITVPGVNISGSNLHFDATDPLYFLVKAGTEQCFYYYDGVGDVDLVNPLVNVNPRGISNPRDYSHVTFFGITPDDPNPNPTPVSDTGTTLALLGLGMVGVAGARRLTTRA